MSSSANSAGDVKQGAETFEELCIHVEHGLGVKIPRYLQNILFYSGFDNRVSLRSLKESDISDLNKFGQSTLYHLVMQMKKGTSQDFYGIYAYELPKKNFTILPGHKILLMHIAAYLREPQARV